MCIRDSPYAAALFISSEIRKSDVFRSSIPPPQCRPFRPPDSLYYVLQERVVTYKVTFHIAMPLISFLPPLVLPNMYVTLFQPTVLVIFLQIRIPRFLLDFYLY